MDPVSAIGVASGVVAFVDFTAKLVSRTYKIYASEDGGLENIGSLNEVATNLRDVVRGIRRGAGGQSDAERQLERLRKEAEIVATDLFDALNDLSPETGTKVWDSFRQVLASIWGESKIKKLERRMDTMRSELNTVLLVCLRLVVSFTTY